jgi:hypothetical protein
MFAALSPNHTDRDMKRCDAPPALMKLLLVSHCACEVDLGELEMRRKTPTPDVEHMDGHDTD